MSNFTTELRYICEVSAGLSESEGYLSINEILSTARTAIFSFEYPIFDEAYRSVLEIKILKHYYTREICAETVGRWKLFLESRLNEIMPYYNKMYQSELMEFNPFYDVDYTKSGNNTGNQTGRNTDNETRAKTDTMTGTVNDAGTSSNTRTDNLAEETRDSGTEGNSKSSAPKNDHWDYFNDTPQGTIQHLENLSYLTNARHIVDDGTGSSESNTTTFGKKVNTTNTGTVQNSGTDNNLRTYNTSNGVSETNQNTTEKSLTSTEQYLERVQGKMPGRSYMELLKEYRDSFLNIDKAIIDELSDLFFGLYE